MTDQKTERLMSAALIVGFAFAELSGYLAAGAHGARIVGCAWASIAALFVMVILQFRAFRFQITKERVVKTIKTVIPDEEPAETPQGAVH